ncbi:MAG TPA: glycosyltransferase [Methylomirabilota bacterium]|nr:glycosyltransferase [Methylomirabilota bacterium]
MTPRVSVVVPVRDAARTLARTLSALVALEPIPDELVFVDNGSTDATAALLEAFAAAGARRAKVLILREPRRGASIARNTGACAATGDVVAFTDADCCPRADWLAALVAPFADPAVGAAAGRLLSTPPHGVVEIFSSLFTLQAAAAPARHTGWTPWAGGFPTANFAVRRELLERLGGFDESVAIYGEDYDLCARLYALGAAIEYTPDAVVEHQHRVALRPMLRQAFGFGRSHAWLMRRHVPRGLWLDLPRRSLARTDFPLPVWIDVGAPDKKILVLLALGVAWRPALALLPLYGGWLWWDVGRRARARGLRVSPLGRWGLVGCLLAKAAAMTGGRWWGSLRYGRACL